MACRAVQRLEAARSRYADYTSASRFPHMECKSEPLRLEGLAGPALPVDSSAQLSHGCHGPAACGDYRSARNSSSRSACPLSACDREQTPNLRLACST
jgi:hypothetical protein